MIADLNKTAPLRVALVHLWAQPYVDNRASGLVYGFENLGRDLRNIGFTENYLFFSNKKRDGDWHPRFIQVSLSDAEILNKFDFVIFGSAGSGADRKEGSWWKPILDVLKVPFAVQVNNEVDQQVLIYKDLFYDHPYFSLGLPITEGLAYEATPNGKNLRSLVYECLPRTGLSDPGEYYGQKVDRIVTSCRMTTRKRVLELVKQAEKLNQAGFEIDVWGADATWFYVSKLKELQSPSWNYHGSFLRDQLSSILGPAKYHYNCCYLSRGTLTPRIETSTIEAVSYGCCPILSRATVPEWVTDEMAVLVDTSDLSDLAERLTKFKGQAHQMNANFWKAYQEKIGKEKLDLLAQTISAIVTNRKTPSEGIDGLVTAE